MRQDERTNDAVSAAVRGATGAVIGHEVDGEQGVVIGAGAAAGAAIGQSASKNPSGTASERVIVDPRPTRGVMTRKTRMTNGNIAIGFTRHRGWTWESACPGVRWRST